MNPYLATIVLLICSNIFMTFAWYGHLRTLATAPYYYAILVSWGIAFFEYVLQVPANRIGHTVMNVGQLKIMQEVITLSVFLPFSVFYMKEKITLDYLWAGLCMVAAVFFIFRGKLSTLVH
ncbi:MAG: DMT family protein [Spirochaetales bacterium]|nr:DMT family protein [Spirochaetales bacterium]